MRERSLFVSRVGMSLTLILKVVFVTAPVEESDTEKLKLSLGVSAPGTSPREVFS